MTITDAFLKVRREACDFLIKKYTGKEPSLAMLEWAQSEWAYIDEIERLRSAETQLLGEIAYLKSALQEQDNQQCDHEDPDNSGNCIKCQMHVEDWA